MTKTNQSFSKSALLRIGNMAVYFTLLLTSPPSGFGQVMVNPEPGAFSGGIQGHSATFRQATPAFGLINTVDDAATLLGYTLPNGNVAFQALGNGTTVINYTDTNSNPRPQQNFGNDLDIRRVPGSLFGAGDQDNYAARFSGYIYIPEAGNWNFTVNSDEGFRLRMGDADTVVLESPNPKLPGNVTGAVTVPSPGFYHYELLWFERTGGSEIEFFANGPGQPADKLVGDPASTLQVFQTLKTIELLHLGIQFLSRSNLLIAWTNSNVVLEEASSLTAANRWQPSSRPPTLLSNLSSVSLSNTGASRFFRLRSYLPPDPAMVASPIDPTVATSIGTSTEFLYTGPTPTQTGVTNGTIEARRAAVVRGKVMMRDNTPLSGVAISVLNHPEFGQTFSRADGMFNLAVNGGGLLTVKYEKTDFCPVQRQLNVPWRDYLVAEDVVMMPMDPIVTRIALGPNSPRQVHQGSVQSDGDGARRATLLFPAGTCANLVLANGSTQACSSLNVRATEFTVGSNGPAAMPATLPPTSGYTYCVELSADEATAQGATSVQFNHPLPVYVQNFLGFPVGTAVPTGYYDVQKGEWIASGNGRVMKVLGTGGGLAELDVDGDNISDDATKLATLGVTADERAHLAQLYPPGETLWRVPVTHFSSWDFNWPYGPPLDAEPPTEDPVPENPLDDSCPIAGSSVIEAQNQILGEVLGVIGTRFGLHYGSERVPGHRTSYRVEIPLSGSQLPPAVRAIELEVRVGGQLFQQRFGPALNQRTAFAWDGRDAYGRTLQGTQPIKIRIGYVYPSVYGTTPTFGAPGTGTLTGAPARKEATLWRTWDDQIAVGAWDSRAAGLGGWTLSAQHAYDPTGQVLYRGDGGRQTVNAIGSTITTFAGTGQGLYSGDGGPAIKAEVGPQGLAVGPDGSVYIASPLRLRIRRVAPGGTITTVAGSDQGAFCTGSASCGDGGPATQAQLSSPNSVAVAADNTLYIGEAGRSAIRKVAPDGIISRFAGTGVSGFSGDGGPATLAQISTAISLAVGPDNSLFIADASNSRIRRIGPDGIITTVAGSGGSGFSGDGGPATLARLSSPRGVAVGADGSIYIADTANQRVRRVTPDGIIRTIAGSGGFGFNGEGVRATEATFRFPSAIAVGRDDTIYIIDQGNNRVRWMRPGGMINTLAGNGVVSTSGDRGPARQAALQGLETGLAVGPDGSVYVSQVANNTRVRRIARLDDFGAPGEIAVPDANGTEIYIFNIAGRHLRTLDGLTGVLRHEFAYDGRGQLATITDINGNVTTIEHDAAGRPTAIVGPYGQVTALQLDANGYLSRVTNPAGEVVRLSHTAEGLLNAVTWPGGQTSSYRYDTFGRLVAATDPTGVTKTIIRTGKNDDFTVTLTSPLGRATTYRVERLTNSDVRLTTTGCPSGQAQVVIGTDGTLTSTGSDGITRRVVFGPDPRWGMQAPIAASQTTTTSNGLANTLTTQRTATLAGPGELLNPLALKETVTINGRAWTNTYNGPSRTFVTTSPAGRRGRMILDEQGRPVQAQNGDLDPIAFTYDNRGRLATAAQAQGAGARVAVFGYGPDGFLASVTDPLGRTRAFTNDSAGRVTAQALPGGRVFGFAHDLNGNMLGVTPPGRPEHAFAYTLRDDVAAYTPPTVGAETNDTRFAYDADRKPTRIDQPGGGAVQFGYEGGTCHLNLVDLGTRQRTYGYDAAGHVISLGASQGISLAHTYDGGIFTRATWSGVVTGSVSWTYDDNFRITAHSVNGSNSVAIQYDADGLAVRAGDLTLTRAGQTGLITATALGASTDAVGYDGFGESVSYTATQGGSAVYAAAYTKDLLGRIMSTTETTGGAARVFGFTYALAGRLTEVRQDGVLTASYSYDPNGNRLSVTGPGGTVTATYDAQDRLLQYGSTTYTNNTKGERQSKTAGGQTTTYQYDGLGNLTGVTLPGGSQVEYVLDGRDRRVGRKIDGTLVQGFLYQDGLRPIAELDGAGTVISRFVYASRINVPDYLVKNGATYRIITDHRGSPRLVLDIATGQMIQRLDYDEFGNVILDTSPGFQPFGFAGGLYDPLTGLVHFGAREYDPETGRWTTKDPIVFGGGDSNLYGYSFGDPVNFWDLNGLQAELILVDPSKNANNLTAVFGAGRYESDEGTYSVVMHAIDGEGRDFFDNPIDAKTLADHILLDLATQFMSGRPLSTYPKKVKLVGCDINPKYARAVAKEVGLPVVYAREPVLLLNTGVTINALCWASRMCTTDVTWYRAQR